MNFFGGGGFLDGVTLQILQSLHEPPFGHFLYSTKGSTLHSSDASTSGQSSAVNNLFTLETETK
jgi:hypothetical protein